MQLLKSLRKHILPRWKHILIMTALCKHLLRHYSIWRNYPKRQRCFTLTVCLPVPAWRKFKSQNRKVGFTKQWYMHNKSTTKGLLPKVQGLWVAINCWNTRIPTLRSYQSDALWLTNIVALSGKLKGAAPPIQSHYQPKISLSFAISCSRINSPISFSKRCGKTQG